jgi:hypothetical protein
MILIHTFFWDCREKVKRYNTEGFNVTALVVFETALHHH